MSSNRHPIRSFIVGRPRQLCGGFIIILVLVRAYQLLFFTRSSNTGFKNFLGEYEPGEAATTTRNIIPIYHRADSHKPKQPWGASISLPTETTETTVKTTTVASISAVSSRSNILQPILHTPKIVFWAKQFHPIDWRLVQLPNGDGGCEVSFDREDIAGADAVVFFMKSCRPNDLPPPDLRRANQVYVWFSHESPWTTRHFYHHSLKQYNNYFNWTMTFRTDSDVLAPMWPTPPMDYLMLRIGRKDDMIDKTLESKAKLSKLEYKRQVKILLRKKTSVAAWIVSDCDFTKRASKRPEIVKQLESAGLKLIKFGKCVNNPLPFNFTVVFETVSTYKFYLAFENSLHCKDYVTEKTLYNSFVSGTVPIIHGPTREDVARILPKGSYIHVEDFENFQKLADYLRYLDKHDSAYKEYFKWWMEPGAQTFPRFGFNYGPKWTPRSLSLPQYDINDLQYDWLEYERFGVYHLCRRLKRGDHISQTHIVPNLARWWYGDQPTECKM